ncbi:dioxygenase [Streptomyces sp. NPDC002324]
MTEDNLSDLAVKRWATAHSPRLAELMTALVRHIHAYARAVRLTEEEWAAAVEWLTSTGRISDDKRQEFILASAYGSASSSRAPSSRCGVPRWNSTMSPDTSCTQLAAWGPEEPSFATELMVSELVTNAVRYGKERRPRPAPARRALGRTAHREGRAMWAEQALPGRGGSELRSVAAGLRPWREEITRAGSGLAEHAQSMRAD